MIRKPSTEFYLGTLVWLLSLAIAFVLWAKGDSEVVLALTPANGAAAVILFLVYLVGYALAHGRFGEVPGRRRKVTGLVVAGIAAALLSAVFFVYGMIGCMFMMLVVQLSALVEKKWAMAAAVLIPAVFVSLDYFGNGSFVFANIALFAVVNILALTISYRALSEEEAKRKSEQLVRELKATQILLSATTKRDERLRIARNLHDILGHQLTALNLQLEVASHVPGDKKQEHIENAKKIGTNLLSNVRDTVSEFRGEKELRLDEALRALAKDIPNLNVALSVDMDESLVDERQVEVLFRCAQEALTNTMKHAKASLCEISVSNDDKELTLVAKDDGRAEAKIKPGNGLKGLVERVEAIDGRLDYSGFDGGFCLTVTLPIGDN